MLSRILPAHAAFPDVIEAMLVAVDESTLRGRDAAGRWSPLEILVHLRDEEIEDFRARAQAAAANAEITHGIDPQGWVVARNYNEQDPVAVMADLRRERAASVEWLRGVTPEQLAGVGRRGDLELRCGDFIAAWRMHDLLHLRQLATTLARLAGRDLDGWELQYAGPIP